MSAIRKSAIGLIALLWALTLSIGAQAQAAKGTIIAYDQHPRMRDFTELEYPPLARQEMVHGVVVVRIQLDDQGAVVSSTAPGDQDIWFRTASQILRNGTLNRAR